MLSYLQITGGLSFDLDMNFPPMFTQLMGVVAAVVNVEFLNMMPLGCVMTSNFHHTLLAYTLGPLVIGVAMMIAYAILKQKGKVEASNFVFGWFLFMTFLILPSVGMKLFSMFGCRMFDSGYGSYLKFYETYAMGSILVYVVGVPLLYAVLLWWNRHLLDPGQKRLEEEHGEAEGLKRALEIRQRLEEQHPQLKSLQFLYKSYEPKYFWFEIFDTIRKQMLTGGLVVLGSGTLSQIIISMLLCLASMRVFAGCKPFIKERVDQFSEMSQWQIFFVMLAALLLRVAEMSGDFDIENKKAFDVILVGTQALAPTVIIVMILMRGQEATKMLVRKVTKSMSRGKSEGVEDEGEVEEGGVQLVKMKKNTMVLGGAADHGTGKSKNKSKSGGVIIAQYENEIIAKGKALGEQALRMNEGRGGAV
ncbi:hypothetical protein TrVE_jg12166 [Triparma verrucosa]|uniref:Uncharacterized protein n=1 Tax=Triparma verrucosa TaxID=1606542 RepID=A0A9W7EVX6_9STRA|nr:hypothetical protein TrVE_jg12166 [Triparma verrucosa]